MKIWHKRGMTGKELEQCNHGFEHMLGKPIIRPNYTLTSSPEPKRPKRPFIRVSSKVVKIKAANK